MNALGLVFTLVDSVLLLTLPRRFAAAPLMLAAVCMTRGQVLEVGPAHLTVLRLIVLVGVVRVSLRKERLAGGLNAVDRALILWAAIFLGMSVFHEVDGFVYRAGIVTDLGCYFLFRCFLVDREDTIAAFKCVCMFLAPLAVLMLFEKAMSVNPFGVLLGGVNEIPLMREGHVRATGPFAHPILAGVAGATGFGMALYLWKDHRRQAAIGLFGGAGVVFACTSSGPILMILFVVLGLAMWPLRERMRSVRWAVVASIAALAAVMKDPVYFLVARIDLSGGSQGYFRAQLIRSSIDHLDEWWLAGTDYTRHWMSSGTYANERHTDITNHILAMGVAGGLPLMFVFIAVLVAAFRQVGITLRRERGVPLAHRFLAWTLGTLMFAHLMNFLSISLFDQSLLFFYLPLAAIGVAASAPVPAASRDGSQSARPAVPLLGVHDYATRGLSSAASR